MRTHCWNGSAVILAVGAGMVLLVGGCGNGSSSFKSPSKSEDKSPTVAAPKSPKTALVPKIEVADWCGEHGIPESICSMCSDKVADECKKKGDWCKEHNRAESQCFVCHPENKAKYEAMKPKAEKGAD